MRARRSWPGKCRCPSGARVPIRRWPPDGPRPRSRSSVRWDGMRMESRSARISKRAGSMGREGFRMPPAARSRNIFPLVDLLTPNETEAAALTGIRVKGRDSAEKAGAQLRKMGCRDVIVTRGARGCLWVGTDGARHFPAFSVLAIDSTGAGDAFNGALAVALAEGRSLQEAIPFANAAGGLTTTRRGAQESLPDRAAIDALLAAGR